MKKTSLLFSFFFTITLSATSISELSDYPQICKAAAEDNVIFQNFKRHPFYQPILEHLSFDQGKDYLSIIETKYPFSSNEIKKCKENDSLGNPFTYFYNEKYDFSSPGTLRYMKVAGELLYLFGDLSNKKIAEIGIGYGGQCKILSVLTQFDSYTLIDLPEVCLLAKKYLKALEVKNIHFIPSTQLFQEENYDLVISNYAFSEISQDEQISYINKIINKSKNGYMICNFISELFNLKSLSLQEILSLINIPNRTIFLLEEDPLTHPQNIVIIWKESSVI